MHRHTEGRDERKKEGRKKTERGLSHDSHLSQTHGEKKQGGEGGRSSDAG